MLKPCLSTTKALVLLTSVIHYDSDSVYACTYNCSSACARELSSLKVLYPNPGHGTIYYYKFVA